MINSPNQGAAVLPPETEIQRELKLLDQTIQSTFDSARMLAQRLQPVLKQVPQRPPSDNSKTSEEVLSDIGGNLRAHRLAVSGIGETLNELLNTLAL